MKKKSNFCLLAKNRLIFKFSNKQSKKINVYFFLDYLEFYVINLFFILDYLKFCILKEVSEYENPSGFKKKS